MFNDTKLQKEKNNQKKLVTFKNSCTFAAGIFTGCSTVG